MVAATLLFRLTRGGGHPTVFPIRSLAVLPFDNLSKDPAQDYFADGMHETLLTDLARAGVVPVIARTSVERYRDGRMPVRDVTRQLGVDALVEGSVLRIGNRVRITVQLVRGDTEEHVWANTYDRDVADVLGLMAEVSDRVTNEIQKVLAGGRGSAMRPSPARAVRPDVLDTYLRARYSFHLMTKEALDRALGLYRRAIELDPAFPAAWTGIAATRTAQAFFGFVAPGEVLPEGRNAARRALSLDDRQGEAESTLGYIALYWDWDFESAGKALRRAVDLSPNSMMVRHEYADFLLVQGNPEASVDQLRAGQALDPMSLNIRGMVLYHTLMARRFREGVDMAAAILQRPGPLPSAAHDYVGRAFWFQGRQAEALIEWRAAFGIGDADYRTIDAAARRDGRKGAMAALAEWMATQQHPKSLQSGAVHTASLFAAAGDATHAFEWLELAYTRREPFLLHIVADPFFDPIRSDTRFKTLLQRIGIRQTP